MRYICLMLCAASCLALLVVVERPPKLPEELASKDFLGCFRLWTGFFFFYLAEEGFLPLGFLCLMTPILRKSSVFPLRPRFYLGARFLFTIFFVFYMGGAVVFLPGGRPTVFLEGVSKAPALSCS